MHGSLVFVALIALATGVALVARWLKFPFTVALVVAGILVGLTHVMPAPHLTKDLLFSVFLPGLLFEAAFHLDVRKFFENKVAILALAVPGVVVSVGLTAAILIPLAPRVHLEGLSVAGAFVFASLIAATDPIAVVALFRTLGAPKRLTVLIEAESLLNDGTSVVLFGIVVAAATGEATSIGAGLLHFVTVAGMGVVVGGAFGLAVSAIIRRVDDVMIEITLTTIAAYGSFVIAEELGYSGVIATVVSGMVAGNYGARSGMTPSTRLAVESFWEYVAFALNSIVFLLIGFQVKLIDLVHAWKPILAAWVAVILARAALVLLVSALLRRTKERAPWSWAALLTWGGLRGGLSMVLALSLPLALEGRDSIVTLAFGVVIVSILVQGLTMPWLLRRLGATRAKVEETHAGDAVERIAAEAALAALAAHESKNETLVRRLRDECTTRARRASAVVEASTASPSDRVEERELRRRLLHAEKLAVVEAARKEAISEDAADEYLRRIDGQLVELADAERDEH